MEKTDLANLISSDVNFWPFWATTLFIYTYLSFSFFILYNLQTKKRLKLQDLSTISIIFLIFTIIDSYVYIPMIRDLRRHPKETAKNINLQTWAWWTISGFVYLSFFALEIKNGLAIFSSTMHLIGCFSVVGLVVYYRNRFELPLFPNKNFND